MKDLNDLVGRKFGRLRLLRGYRKPSSRGWATIFYKCVCTCGNKIAAGRYDLISGNTKSCGCYARERSRVCNYTHKLSKTSEYRCWSGMIDRCYNKNSNRYHTYGARGITVCLRWKKFENFIKDMGARPSKDHSIDRVNNNKSYSLKNCKWSTRSEQACNRTNNRTLTYRQQTMTIAEWSRYTGVAYGTLYARFNILKWSIKNVIEAPIRKRFAKKAKVQCVNLNS